MRPIELELERTVAAPPDQVFDRLVDIDGYNDWLPGPGTMLRSTRQTSPGPPTVGTTYVDDTSQGAMPGEIVDLEPGRTVVFHWWQTGRSGKVVFEGWPAFHLESAGEQTTLVRHTARLQVSGAYGLARPVFGWLARRERTATLVALQRSFE